MVNVFSRNSLSRKREEVKIAEGFDLSKEFNIVQEGSRVVAEFQSTGEFPAQWFQRQRYEVDFGRDLEPLLYENIYSIVRDPNLPRSVVTFELGPGGVVFEEVTEGGEVKFASVGQNQYTVVLRHYGIGFEYTKDMFMFNELYRLPIIERQAGVAFNALMNHLHLGPIITHTYTGANITNGTTLTSFRTTASMPEKYLRAIEAAITTMKGDTVNPRRGPYSILCSTADAYTLERALRRGIPQEGFDQTSSVLGEIREIIAYDGWTGVRGAKRTTYPGVTSGDAYIVSTGLNVQDFQSFEKQPLQATTGDRDVSRFVLDQTVWDFYLGVYANPVAGAHRLQLPTATSGQA